MKPGPQPTLRDAVIFAMGEASMCWEHPERAGAFDFDASIAVANELLAAIDTLRPGGVEAEPEPGVAT